MWLIYAFLSAFFAGVTAILAKIGIRKTPSDVVTAVRTVVVLVFSWIMVFVVGSAGTLPDISGKSLLFLFLSGLATGASWLCYFKALGLGNVNKVAPIDKSSTVLSMLLAFFILGETATALKLVAMVLIAAGTLLMITKKPDGTEEKSKAWLLFAVLSAVFAALTSILGKIGIENVESNLGTALRTVVVLVMAWGIVFLKGEQKEALKMDRKSLAFTVLSGFTTGGSWLFYYRALQLGEASVVVPIDKMSILVTLAFSYFVFREKLTKKAAIGLLLMVGGTLLLLVK